MQPPPLLLCVRACCPPLFPPFPTTPPPPPPPPAAAGAHAGGLKSLVVHADYNRPTKLVVTREYLVKWAGLSYKECSWEAEAVLRDPQGLDAKAKVFKNY